MSENVVTELLNVDQIDAPVHKPKPKRTIVHFAGDKPVAINLDQVSIIRLEGKSIFFDFHTKTQQVDLADETAANSVLQTLMNLWTGDVNE